MSEKKSSYDKGFLIRMGVLLGLLVILGGAFLLDKNVVRPNNEKAIEKVFAFYDKNSDGLTREGFEKGVGFGPSKTLDRGKYKVDVYRYGGVLPFLPASYVYAVFEDDICMHVTQMDDQVASEESLANRLKPLAATRPDKIPDIVAPGGAATLGGPPPTDNKTDAGSGDKTDADTGAKAEGEEEKKDATGEESGEKKEGGEEKTGDGDGGGEEKGGSAGG